MSLRIKPSDINPILCYWCFNSINSNSEITHLKELPYHKTCIPQTILDKRRYDLIDTYLDYWQLYKSDQYIEYVLNHFEERIIDYVLDVTDEYITVYVLTEQKLIKVSRSFDHQGSINVYSEFDVQEIEFLKMLFN